MLRKPRLRLIRVTRERKLQLPTRPQAPLDLARLGTLLALDADHLRPLDDVERGAFGEVHEDLDGAGEAALGVGDGGWVVGDEEAHLELGVVVEDVVVLETFGGGLVVGHDAELFTHVDLASAQGLELVDVLVPRVALQGEVVDVEALGPPLRQRLLVKVVILASHKQLGLSAREVLGQEVGVAVVATAGHVVGDDASILALGLWDGRVEEFVEVYIHDELVKITIQ